MQQHQETRGLHICMDSEMEALCCAAKLSATAKVGPSSDIAKPLKYK
ncbi:hypothetical protein U5A82_16435 [Sphingobium sp. CR2-8]|nr:hypothetical protein [Sphingobium sp. CR2-8]MEC3912003.1 hypothetical protein [Sphingobium sp. CR2-8]